MNTSSWPKFCRWTAAAFCLYFAAVLLAAEARIAFDVPAGEARDTLKKFAQQAGREIVFSPVGATKTQAVKGQFTVREALDRLLAGTDLTAFEDAKTGGMVVRRGDDPNAPRAAPAAATAQPMNPATARTNDEEAILLDAFQVSTKKDRGYGTTHTVGGTRVNVAIIDAPVSVVTVNEQMLSDLGFSNVADSLQFVSGVAKTSGPNNGQLVIRGVANTLPFGFVDGIDTPNGSAVAHSMPNSAALERVEIIKGPDGVLYGNGSLGGVVNRIYRRPTRKPALRLEASGGSFDTYAGLVDATGPVPLGKNPPTLFYRVIASKKEGDTPQARPGVPFAHDSARAELNWFPVAGLKTWVVGDFGYFSADQSANMFVTRTSTVRGARAEIPIDRLPRRLTLGNPGYGGSDQRDTLLEFGTSKAFSWLTGDWSLRAVARHNTQKGSFEPYPLLTLRFVNASGASLGTTDQILFSDPRWADIQIQSGLKRRRTTGRSYNSLNLDLTGDVRTGPVRHKFVVFGSTNYSASDLSESRWDWNPEFQSIFNVRSRPEAEVLSNYRYDSLRALSTTFARNSHVALQDNLSVLDGRLIGVVGRRYNEGRSNTLLPLINTQELGSYARSSVDRYGLVAKPIKGRGFALFYNHSEIYLGPPTVHAPSGIRLPERFGRQKEFGAKLELLEGRMVATASRFDISSGQSVVTTLDTVTGNNVYTLRDAIINHGYEGDIAWQPLPELSVFASYQWLESKENLTGARQRGVPQGANYSAVAKYSFAQGPLKRLGVGAAWRHSGPYAGDLPDTFTVPGYSVTNLFLNYPWRHYEVQLNVNNLFNRRYVETGVSALQLYSAPGTNFQLRVTWRL